MSTGHHRYAVMTPDGEHLMELPLMKEAADELAASALRYASASWPAIVGAEAPMSVLYGFEAPDPWRFDCVVGTGPGIHRLHQVKSPSLHERTFSLAVAYSWEILPSLTSAEVIATRKLVAFADLNRPAQALARAKVRAGSVRTVGERRAMTDERSILASMEQQRGVPDGFIEVENARGELAVVWFRDGFVINGPAGESPSGGQPSDAVEWVSAFLRRPVSGLRARPGGLPGVQGVGLDPDCTLSLEGGTVADELSDWQLRDELDRLRPDGPDRFAVLRREAQRYIQTYANDDGTFDVEYRDGDRSHHFKSDQAISRDELKQLFVAYATQGDNSWRTALPWTPATILAEQRPRDFGPYADTQRSLQSSAWPDC